ncbi:MAG: hypothetical protein CFH10_00772 [Alphaproteobacteria bacterium MarineAlpha4_Bin2]|nr:MAG: hypothetical protein CFH10_00772 [Alphaproteobacteria bacterium MarineAlpha4_Bin2]
MTSPKTNERPVLDRTHTLQFEYNGRINDLVPIVLLNTLLNILTLTIYRFWGKTRVRRYLWDSTALLGDRLEYHGTGGELCRGFLFVLFVIFVPVAITEFLISSYFPLDHAAHAIFQFSVGLLFWSLLGVAIYRARRYRLSRTRWRGVRASQTGSSFAYSMKYIAFTVLTIITLGWAYPIMRMRLMGMMMNNTWFGDRRFYFEGPAWPLYKRFTICWLFSAGLLLLLGVTFKTFFSNFNNAANIGSLTEVSGSLVIYGIIGFLALGIILGVTFCFYKAAELRQFARSTRFEGLDFVMNVTTGRLLWLVIGNTLILLLTLGFGLAFTQMRVFRFACNRIDARGSINFDAIIQSKNKGPDFGEGLADALDVGAV